MNISYYNSTVLTFKTITVHELWFKLNENVSMIKKALCNFIDVLFFDCAV